MLFSVRTTGGLTYGITFVDNKNKTVFNGSDLGKAYSAKAISERFSNQDKLILPACKAGGNVCGYLSSLLF